MKNTIYLGAQSLDSNTKEVKEQFSIIDNEQFYTIENYTEMPSFFMTITSNSNHWMFISSTGGLTAGRVNSESSVFPYYTDDRITENYENSGPKTIILATINGKTYQWKPFSEEGREVYNVSNSLSKNVVGNKVKFEEVNETLGISFSYMWMNSKRYGLVRKSIITNLNNPTVEINIVDGLQNILPSGVESQIQNEFSCLLNGYKRTQLDKSGLGLFTLSATLTDLAEPSEALKANTVWQSGLTVNNYLLGNNQLKAFSKGAEITTDTDYKGERGCYFVQSKFILDKGADKEWIIVADVDKDLTDVTELKEFLNNTSDKVSIIESDVNTGSEALKSILNQNDGLQYTNSKMNTVHHQANVLFNIMRGGFFYNSYTISRDDFNEYIGTTNKKVHKKYSGQISKLKDQISYDEILEYILNKDDKDLSRIWYEYLPLTFSRRHGDPSRPWNKFSIQTEKEDGSAKLDYQGNWRDIFQNWEALCYSYPEYIKHTIGKFLNASTKDGYNPYRVAKDGIDWEAPEPGNPWANIGYWSDHQIIYLLKLLEMYQQHKPENLQNELNDQVFTFANVPYEIKSFENIVVDPYETIDFNFKKDEEIKAFAKELGADGKMLHNTSGDMVLTSLTEKLLIHLLAKLGNYVPEGGIWMNTQRPEWNDANNALVGKGISVVTLAYIRRYITFMIEVYSTSKLDSLTIGDDTAAWFSSLSKTFNSYATNLSLALTDKERYNFVESVGLASDKFREGYYVGKEVNNVEIKIGSMLEFLDSALNCVDDTLHKNRREDNLYHSYNTLEIKSGEMKIHYLYEMLEGQVAILTSGLLTPTEADATFNALRNSKMYREDQHSYMLYPNRELPGFTEKNIISTKKVTGNKILSQLLDSGNRDIITKDITGQYHFNGSFKNSKDVAVALAGLGINDKDKNIESLFEETFNHQSFTGRSGTFFAYEGLGSIYWHMVSKLLLAAGENLFWAMERGADSEIIKSLKAHYYDVRDGIGYNKTAKVYGAFPFDPYSHTPFEKGAKQPGMTGQVKEEVITRLSEMGVYINSGEIMFKSTLIDEKELLQDEATWSVQNNSGVVLDLKLPVGSFAGTHCQTPFIIKKSNEEKIIIHFTDGANRTFEGNTLPADYSRMIFKKMNNISYLEVELQI